VCRAEAPSPEVGLNDPGASLPAWDGQLAVLPPKSTSGGLAAVSTAKLRAWLAGKFGDPTGGGKRPAVLLKVKTGDWSEDKLWTTEDMVPVAFVLAKDELVAAYEARVGSRGYKVGGFRRTDGAKVWSVDLPEQPVMNRLALDRDGRVLVALCDGSVLCLGR
jgi:hypothetical protein